MVLIIVIIFATLTTTIVGVTTTTNYTSESFIIKYRTTICTNCVWEYVFAGHPSDPNKLIFSGDNKIGISIDAGRTWNINNIDEIVDYSTNITNNKMYRSYRSDPKIAVLDDGFFLSGLYQTSYLNNGTWLINPFTGGILYRGTFTSDRFNISIFQDFQDVVYYYRDNLLADFPQLAVDPQSSSVYITNNMMWFEGSGEVYIWPKDDLGNTVHHSAGLYISQDLGKTFNRYEIGEASVINSIAIDMNKTLYLVDIGPYPAKLIRSKSFDTFSYDIRELPSTASLPAPKLFNNTEKVWITARGPQILIDTNQMSPNRGRLYLVWAEFINGSYDILVSYSDDRGEIWSSPVRANDDTTNGDQFFQSAKLDYNGLLHIVFIDHRNNQDMPFFDVYYTNSKDGISFSKNLRITDKPFPNRIGDRSIGDYFDMIMPYLDRVYITYPCGEQDIFNDTYMAPESICMVELTQPEETTTPTTTTLPSTCTIKGDKDCDGSVDDFELLDYINLWVNVLVGDFDLLDAIRTWAKV